MRDCTHPHTHTCSVDFPLLPLPYSHTYVYVIIYLFFTNIKVEFKNSNARATLVRTRCTLQTYTYLYYYVIMLPESKIKTCKNRFGSFPEKTGGGGIVHKYTRNWLALNRRGVFLIVVDVGSLFFARFGGNNRYTYQRLRRLTITQTE